MEDLVIYCKSYYRDVLRAKKMAQSVRKFNADNIPFYISAPEKDLVLFREHLADIDVTLIPDEDIIKANPKHLLSEINSLAGGISQQIVKSEFWRLGLCENYVCIDSDAEFLRSFHKSDFLAPDGSPYTVIVEDKEFFTFCERYNLPKVHKHFRREAEESQQLFNRPGKAYAYGIPPLVWSRQVWKCLEEKILIPRHQTFADLIQQYPYELRLYGETLMRYKPIPIWPCEPFFKNYLYNTQYFYDQKHKMTSDLISHYYLGIVWQSNWEGEHFGGSGKSFASRLLKNLKRQLRKLSV